MNAVGTKNPQRALNPIEDKILEDANGLGVGAQGLGGRTTILAAHVGVSETPADRWNVAVLVTSWACRRQAITLDAKGGIADWGQVLSESSHREPEEPETASEAELEMASDWLDTLVAQGLPFPLARRRAQEEFERRYVTATLARHGGSVAAAAKASGIAQRYFRLVRARQQTRNRTSDDE